MYTMSNNLRQHRKRFHIKTLISVADTMDVAIAAAGASIVDTQTAVGGKETRSASCSALHNTGTSRVSIRAQDGVSVSVVSPPQPLTTAASCTSRMAYSSAECAV